MVFTIYDNHILGAANDKNIAIRKIAHVAGVEPAIDKARNASAEEAAAYAFQFWAAGDLKLGNDSVGFFAKVGRFFRNLAGITREHERSEAFLDSFMRGEMGKADFKPSALEKAFGERNGDRMMKTVKDHMEPFMKVVHTVMDSSVTAMKPATAS